MVSMPKPKVNLADAFIYLNKFSDMVRALHKHPDLPEAEKQRIRSAIKIMKMDIEDLLNSVGGES